MNLSQSNTPMGSHLCSNFSYDQLDIEEKINRFLDNEGVFMEESPNTRNRKSIKTSFKSISALSSPIDLRRKDRKLTTK